MRITKETVAEKIAEYLHQQITLSQLVDWAENAIQEGEFDEDQADALQTVVGRLGVADVRAFGLTWNDCQELLGQLGYSARIEITSN